MLSAPPVGIPDDPLSPYVLDSWNAHARIVAQVAVCEALGDEVAWEMILGPTARLGAFRSVYGNRRGKRRGPRRG